MSPDRSAALVAGVLYVLSMLAGLLSVTPSVDGRDFMVETAAHRRQVLRATFFQLLMAPAYIGIAVTLYPQLRRHGEGSALGFVGFRIIAAAFVLAGALLLLLLLSVSQDFVDGEDSARRQLRAVGDVLRIGRDLVNHVAMVLALGGGSLLLYALLLHAQLIPRWLSVWGLGGAALAMAASMSVMSGRSAVTTPKYLALTVPLALQEFVFAVWLIVNGLRP